MQFSRFWQRISFNLVVTFLSGLIAFIVATHRLLMWIQAQSGAAMATESRMAWFWQINEKIDENWAGMGLSIVALFALCFMGYRLITYSSDHGTDRAAKMP